MRRVLTRILVLLCLFATMLPAQACLTCDGKGENPCPACAFDDASCEACTVGAACSRCGGARALPCPDCGFGVQATPRLQKRAAAARLYLIDFRTMLQANGIDPRGLMQCRGKHVELLFAPGKVAGFAVDDPHQLMHFYLALLEKQILPRLFAELGAFQLDGLGLRIVLLKDERAVRRLCRELTGREAQGLGGTGAARTLLLQQTAATANDQALRRFLTFHTAATLLDAYDLDHRGLGWLQVGFAHWLEADQGGGLCENFRLQRRPQAPQRFWDGAWRLGVRELLEQGRLPTLTELFGRDADDFDFAQQAAAFAFVDFLLQRPQAPITHGLGDAPTPSLFARLFRLCVESKDVSTTKALPELLGKDLPTIEQEFHAFVIQRYPRK